MTTWLKLSCADLNNLTTKNQDGCARHDRPYANSMGNRSTTGGDLQFRRRWFRFDAESFYFRPFRLTFDFLSLIT